MPIPIGPMTFSCPQCGWSRTLTPRSDTLGAEDFISTCPKCANTKLVLQRGTPAGGKKPGSGF